MKLRTKIQTTPTSKSTQFYHLDWNHVSFQFWINLSYFQDWHLIEPLLKRVDLNWLVSQLWICNSIKKIWNSCFSKLPSIFDQRVKNICKYVNFTQFPSNEGGLGWWLVQSTNSSSLKFFLIFSKKHKQQNFTPNEKLK